MWFKADRTGPCVNWIVWIPRFAKKPVPLIAFLNYRGNYELVADADIPLMTAWCRNAGKAADHRATEATRGLMQRTEYASDFPIRTILARGYAVMSACYCEVSPDPAPDETDPRWQQRTFAYKGVLELWGPRDESRTDNITSIGAWGWALSRGLDREPVVLPLVLPGLCEVRQEPGTDDAVRPAPLPRLRGSEMPKVGWPDDYDTSAVGRRLGYVRRNEGHGISAYDWKWMMDFADRTLAL